MTTLFITLGVLTIVAGIAWHFISRIEVGRGFGEAPKHRFRPASLKRTVLTVSAGIVLAFGQALFFYAEPGYYYFLQYPNGKQAYVTSSGFKWRGFANLRPLKQLVTTVNLPAAEIVGSPTARREPFDNVRFSDSVIADVWMVARFEMPADPEQGIRLMRSFRTQENVVASALVPFNGEVVRNAARTLTGQGYVAGAGGQFETAVYDQLQHGIYILDTEQIRVGVEEGAADPILPPWQRQVERDEVTRLKVSRRIGPDGEPLRKPHPWREYGISLSQATVENVVFEAAFRKRIEEQRDAAALASIEREKARTAEFTRQKIITEGESEKATMRVTQEKQQIESVIAAETKKLEAEQLLAAERLNAQAIEVMARAEAEARRLKMQADNALEQRLAAQVQMNKDAWTAIAQIQGVQLVPTYNIGGGNGDGSMSVQDFMGLVSMDVIRKTGVDAARTGG